MLPVNDAPVVRLHLRSTLDVDHVAIEERCLRADDGLTGVGWGLWDSASDGIDWAAYCDRVAARGARVDPTVALLHRLPDGTLVWTRRRDGSYWLGRLTGGWQYSDCDEAQRLDLFNTRPSEWRIVGTEDSVPGKIVNNFRASKTLNPVTDHGAVLYSRRLWRQLNGEAGELAPIEPQTIIASLLGATDLEDLIATYLQDQHELVLVSRGRSTVGYEYVLRHRKTGRRSVATVKSGEAPVDLDALPPSDETDLWAFAVREGHATGAEREDVRWISLEDLMAFMRDRPEVLPDQVVRWTS